MAKVKNTKVDSIKKDDVIDFLNFISRKAKSNNIDQFLRNGQLKEINDLFECGKYFLTHAMGCDESDFIPNLKFKEFACYVPVSENYYPWAFFAVPTTTTDLSEFFDHHGRNYLLSADSGKKDFAVVTNFKTIQVFDFNHHQEKYECDLASLYDIFTNTATSIKEVNKQWYNLLQDFGPEKAAEKKNKRRKEVVEYVKPKEASPELQYVKRFGHMPSFDTPVGYDGNNFRDTFKTKNLPFLTTETIDWDGTVKKNENRIVWGDNLSVMRSLPDDSIDLIYIDPPFFSGRDYNKIFGDDDEVRTFSDIWDGGLPTYLAWLNARLWEMKRILKPTGNIIVHLDWHAAHYVKVEMDKIFGYGGDKTEPGFRNEIVWHYFMGGKPKAFFARKHDTLLWYTKTANWKFNYQTALRRLDKKPSMTSHKGMFEKDGAWYSEVGMDDVWDISGVFNMANEFIGYPTQKPEALIERLITALTDDGDLVADFFSGGGTTISVAEKLGRRWFGCDISRIAVSVARDRVSSIYTKEAGIKPKKKQATVGFSIQYNGVYERDLVRELDEKSYQSFILSCYQAVPKITGDYIHGFREEKAVYVAPAKKNLRKDQIEEFHAELLEKKITSGIVLTWNVSKDLEKYIDELRQGSNGPDIQIIQVKLVDIDSNEFKGDNIRFLNKPAAVIRKTHQSGLSWVFDATASQGTNGSDIHYYQWDFNYKNRFSPSTKTNFKDGDGDGNSLNDHRRIEFTFPEEGRYKVALRIFDKAGAESTQVVEVDASVKSKKVS